MHHNIEEALKIPVSPNLFNLVNRFKQQSLPVFNSEQTFFQEKKNGILLCFFYTCHFPAVGSEKNLLYDFFQIQSSSIIISFEVKYTIW